MATAKITKSFTFHAGHRLTNHAGKCKRLHGHTYRVDIEVQGIVSNVEGASSEGMVLDFDVIKAQWSAIETSLDHRFLLWKNDPLYSVLFREEFDSVVPFDNQPTAENIARYIWERLARSLEFRASGEHPYCALSKVTVWETETSSAMVDSYDR